MGHHTLSHMACATWSKVLPVDLQECSSKSKAGERNDQCMLPTELCVLSIGSGGACKCNFVFRTERGLVEKRPWPRGILEFILDVHGPSLLARVPWHARADD